MTLTDMNQRKQISTDAVNKGLHRLSEKLTYRLEEKGRGTMASSHEILGILEEEMHELREAVRSNNPEHIKKELLDVAVGAVFGEICLNEGTVDWPWIDG